MTGKHKHATVIYYEHRNSYTSCTVKGRSYIFTKGTEVSIGNHYF